MSAPLQDFALVTEGVTDHAILINILLGFFKEQRAPSIVREQPLPSEVKKHGGWTLLLKYLQDRKYEAAFQLNQFVIVHVDTDVADNSGFDVARNDQNGVLTAEAFIGKVVERLKAEIGPADLERYAGRFIFAVSVEQTECWLLPLWYDDHHCEATDSCFDRLEKCQKLSGELKKKDEYFTKDYELYLKVSKEYRKPRILKEKGSRNPSLNLFLNDLTGRNIVLPPLDD